LEELGNKPASNSTALKEITEQLQLQEGEVREMKAEGARLRAVIN
jgi:hypothetical protein